MKLSDSLSQEVLSKLASNTVSVGDVYEINMTTQNGLTLKSGYKSRNKYFVVLGFDENGIAYGGVVINSHINYNMDTTITDFLMPIKKSKYPFLRYDSFVDCSKLMTAEARKFNEWHYLGSINDDDVAIIIGTIKESPRENEAHLALYGL